MNPIQSYLSKNSLMSILSFVVDLVIIIMPACGYLDTARIMIETQNPSACNFIQCLILISAQGLKIFYRIFRPYATRVFGQSLSQFSVAFLIVFLKYHYTKQQAQVQQEKSNPKVPNFFHITKMRTFIEFMISFSIYLAILILIFSVGYNYIDKKSTIESVGVVANLIETTIVLPLFYKVVIQRDINSLSKILVIQFAVGDIMRLVLFILSKAPASFIAGVCLQITLDLIMFANYLHLYLCSDKNKEKHDLEELIPKSQIDQNDENSLTLEINQNQNQNEKLNIESFENAENI